MITRALALAVASTTVFAACGSADDESATPELRTIEVTMTDMAFTPATLDVSPAESVRFLFRNEGAVRHEAVFGDLAAQEAHHAEMAEMGGSHEGMDMESMPHEGEMSGLHAVVVEPGETVEVVHAFGEAGTTMIGCHEPGHWEAGMKMELDI